MDWVDEGFVLSCRPHGENGAIVSALTSVRGRHAGLVQGGLSARQRPVWQAGNLLRLEWRARLTEHLGHFRGEVLAANAARVMDDPLALAGVLAACATLDAALPEREPHAAVFDGFAAFATIVGEVGWPSLLVRLELGLLQELGFGLDLTCCALSGVRDDLAWVSPRTGRAVTRSAGEPWKEKLLALPRFLAPDDDRGIPPPSEIVKGFDLTGYFLERHVFWPHNKPLPAARDRLMELLQRDAVD